MPPVSNRYRVGSKWDKSSGKSKFKTKDGKEWDWHAIMARNARYGNYFYILDV